MPLQKIRCFRLMEGHPDFQSGDMGSNPISITIRLISRDPIPRWPPHEVLVQRSAYLSSKQRISVRVRYTPPEYPAKDIDHLQLVMLTSYFQSMKARASQSATFLQAASQIYFKCLPGRRQRFESSHRLPYDGVV